MISLCTLTLILFYSFDHLRECEISNIKITNSPNNKNKLAFNEIGGGLTVRNSYQLSVMDYKQHIDSEIRWNILVCFSDKILPVWKDNRIIQFFFITQK